MSERHTLSERHTIGNPGSVAAQALEHGAKWLVEAIASIGSPEGAADSIRTRRLTTADLRAALQAGARDFARFRSDVIFLVALYPVIGLLLVGFGLHLELLPLIFPMTAGFALLGPVAAVGLYEMSRRAEAGEPVNWATALAVATRPGFAAVLVLGFGLFALFLAWLLAAAAIHALTLGPEPPASIGSFLREVFTTPAGWAMIAIGFAVGFVFAAIALAVSVVSFPLLIDRPVGVPAAVAVSLRVTRENPRVIAAWGLIVAAGLALGALPALIGLVVVLPILGHATWHLYRRAVRPE